jgi:moderate conductance mechanosensitive channel
MLIEDLLRNELVQIAIVFVAVSPIIIIGRRLIDRTVRRLVQSGRYETKVDERKREDTIINMFNTLFTVIVWIIAIFSILSILHINVGALATGAGVFGVIIGFGAQNTIKDYIAGVFILMENQYRVGDIVTLRGGTTGTQGVSGLVEEITLRITRLRDLDGTLSTIRNGEATVITNRTFKYSSVVVELSLDFASDMKKVEKIVNETGTEMLTDADLNKMITEPLAFFRVSDLKDGYIVQVVGKVKPAAQWDVASDFRRRIIPAFAEAGITLATPQVTLKDFTGKKPSK